MGFGIIFKDDKEAHNTLLAINTHGGELKIQGDYHLINEEEAFNILKMFLMLLQQYKKIAGMVGDKTLILVNGFFPAFPLEENETPETQLKNMSTQVF